MVQRYTDSENKGDTSKPGDQRSQCASRLWCHFDISYVLSRYLTDIPGFKHHYSSAVYFPVASEKEILAHSLLSSRDNFSWTASINQVCRGIRTGRAFTQALICLSMSLGSRSTTAVVPCSGSSF